MSLGTRFRRLLAYASTIVLVAVALTIVVFHAQQRLRRHRAEQLLSDIRALDLRVSTYADAQKIFQRWGPWGRYVGACSEKHCEFEVNLWNFPSEEMDAWRDRSRWHELIDGRPARVTATVTVVDGVVWQKNFMIAIAVPPLNEDNAHSAYDYVLVGDSITVSRFSPATPQLFLHPNYVTDSPGICTGCKYVYARFSPFAEPSDVRRLMDFDFSCLTRWKPCREPADLMPVVWAQYHMEASAVEAIRTSSRVCSRQQVQMLGRDADHVALGEIVRTHSKRVGNEMVHVLTMRLLRRMKHAEFWTIGTAREVSVLNEHIALAQGNAAENLKPLGQFAILFHNYEVGGLGLEECGLVPATKENLDLVLNGIGQDFLSGESVRQGSGLE